MVALAKMLLTLACLLLCTSDVLHNVRAESDLSTKKQSLGSGAADEGEILKRRVLNLISQLSKGAAPIWSPVKPTV